MSRRTCDVHADDPVRRTMADIRRDALRLTRGYVGRGTRSMTITMVPPIMPDSITVSIEGQGLPAAEVQDGKEEV